VNGLYPFLIAFQFLTRLPVRLPGPPDERDIGRSLLYYPLVGLLLGLVLAALAGALRDTAPLLGAALLLTAWVVMTGGLHLDGLADSADAWVGGQGSRERSLAIMKDPCCGPAGVVALMLVLVLKLASLETLVAQHQALPLALAPLMGRASLTALFISTPYVRPGGLGEALARCARRPAAAVVAVAVAAIALTTGRSGLWPLASALVTFIALRALMLRRLGGPTGDIAGALLEIIEASTLVAAAMLCPPPGGSA
jgi:adenosylcobinamide-GDP ribazoletransferase